jgi:hypothetical protein
MYGNMIILRFHSFLQLTEDAEYTNPAFEISLIMPLRRKHDAVRVTCHSNSLSCVPRALTGELSLDRFAYAVCLVLMTRRLLPLRLYGD